MLKPVGILWDSISNNTGDIAIGMLLKRYCEIKGISYKVVDPFGFNPSELATLIIGGGQIIRRTDDIFYQSFRVPGPHILNAVGIHQPDQLEYLRGYRLVSVRSEAEKAIVMGMVPGLQVKVTPCNTIQMEKYFAQEIEELKRNTPHFDECIGVHLNNTTLSRLPNLIEALKRINRKYRIVFIPFTHYENDRHLMDILAKWLPNATVSPENDPLSIFAVIGSLRAMISSSMHAAMFAYVQNVPVLAFPQDHKLRYFFEERCFPDSLYESADSLPGKLDALLQDLPDYSLSIDIDKRKVDAQLDEIEQIVNMPVDTMLEGAGCFGKSSYNELRRRYYTIILQNFSLLKTKEAEIIDLQLSVSELQEATTDLENMRNSQVQPQINSKGIVERLLLALKRMIGMERQNLSLIQSSDLFDRDWYLMTNPDVASGKIEPTLHYLRFGGFEGRDPSPYFASGWYLHSYPDVKSSGLNPLVHYLKYGRAEGRHPRP